MLIITLSVYKPYIIYENKVVTFIKLCIIHDSVKFDLTYINDIDTSSIGCAYCLKYC